MKPAYRYYVYCDDQRLRGFDEEWAALQYMDEEIEPTQHSASTLGHALTLKVIDEQLAGKDSIVGMYVCRPTLIKGEKWKKERVYLFRFGGKTVAMCLAIRRG